MLKWFRKLKKQPTSQQFIEAYMGDEAMCNLFSQPWFRVPGHCRDQYEELSIEGKQEVVRFARSCVPVTYAVFRQRYWQHGCTPLDIARVFCKGDIEEDWSRLSSADKERIVKEVKTRLCCDRS